MGIYINKNGTAKRQDGAASPAGSIAFDPAGTVLESTDVEGAIKEVAGLIKYDSVSGTTNANGVLETTISYPNRRIIGAWMNTGVDRFVSVGVSNSNYYFKVTNGAWNSASNQGVQIQYAYI